jgi:hypothetical protein
MLSLCGCALLRGKWVDLNEKTRPARSGARREHQGMFGPTAYRLGDVDIFGERGSAEDLVGAKDLSACQASLVFYMTVLPSGGGSPLAARPFCREIAIRLPGAQHASLAGFASPFRLSRFL